MPTFMTSTQVITMTLSRLFRLSLVAIGTVLWLFSLPAHAAASGGIPADIEQRLAACAQCHGKQGQGVADDTHTPHLAGKPAGYLYQQLQAFRAGKRSHAPMQYVVKQLSDDYLKVISRYYAAQPIVYEPEQVTATQAELERGEQLAKQGDGQIPSCESCHGPRLTGVAPMIPGVVGLSYDYLHRQLKLWHDNKRAADGTHCMWVVANRMNANDLKAVALWLAAQPIPDDPSLISEDELAEPLPGWCGIKHEEVN